MKIQPRYIPVLANSLVTVILMLFVEIFFFYFTSRHVDLFRDDADKYIPTRDDAEKFITSRFDPVLGWDNHDIARNLKEGKSYLATSFGDSFTYGDEVANHETWQAVFENLTGLAVLNMGVGGYGVDQAVLKFEKYAAENPAMFCILGVNSEMYRRVLSYQSRYYFKSWLYAFKPILIQNNQQFELQYPPCKSSECLVELLRAPSQELRELLETHDYWYQEEQNKPVRGFPYTISFLKTVPQFLRRLKENRGLSDAYFMTENSVYLTRYLIKRFDRGCQQLDAKPLVLVLNGPHQLSLIRKSGKRWDQWLIEFLEENDIPFVDTTEIILEKYPAAESFSFLAAPHLHFNAEGNNLIGTALADYFSMPNHLPGTKDN